MAGNPDPGGEGGERSSEFLSRGPALDAQKAPACPVTKELEAQEIESPTSVRIKAAETKYASFLLSHSEPELAQPVTKRTIESLGI